MRRRHTTRRAVITALLLAVCVPAGNAQALEAPEILYRDGVSENEPGSPWRPLEGAHVDTNLGFIVGTRAQAKPPRDGSVYHRLTALETPDGHPDQGPEFGTCLSRAQAPGTEMVLGLGRFEGPGRYTIKLEVNLPSNGASSNSCSGGPSSTATFTMDPTVGLEVVAPTPLMLSAGDGLSSVTRATIPGGARAETHCARDAAVRADGDVDGADSFVEPGPEVLLRSITRNGRWTCVARARVAVSEIPDGPHYTRWSAPVSFDTIAGFSADLTVPDRRPKRFTIAYSDMPPGSEGGVVTLRISRGKRCPKVATKTLRDRVDSKRRVRFTFNLPEKNRSRGLRRGVDTYGWVFRFAFAGTPTVLPARDTQGAFLYPKRHDLGHVLGFPGIDFAYCTWTA